MNSATEGYELALAQQAGPGLPKLAQAILAAADAATSGIAHTDGTSPPPKPSRQVPLSDCCVRPVASQSAHISAQSFENTILTFRLIFAASYLMLSLTSSIPFMKETGTKGPKSPFGKMFRYRE